MIERGQPVYSLNRAFIQPALNATCERLGLQRIVDHEHLRTELAQSFDQRLADAAAIGHDNYTAVCSQRHARWFTEIQRRPQIWHRHASRNFIRGGHVAIRLRGCCRGRNYFNGFNRRRSSSFSRTSRLPLTHSLFLQIGPAIINKFNRVCQCWKIAQLQRIIAWNVIRGANRRKHFRLLDGVDAEISLQIQFEIEHLDGIAGLCGNELQHFFFHWIGCSCRNRFSFDRCCYCRCNCQRLLQIRPAIINKLDRVRQCWEVT
ncbi:MAG: hypothetical protein ALAOOOJD_04613 [bacterium]|nr:hypothetical protein [bacterium]